MSRANLYVLFPNGEVRYGIYDGTSDVAQPFLCECPDDAWNQWNNGPWGWDFDPAGAVPVLVATDYGSGWCWPAAATKDALVTQHYWDDFCGYCLREGDIPMWATYPAPITSAASALQLISRTANEAES